MVATDRVKEIFDDAIAQHQAALERMAAGDIRDAAEKAWCATKRATDALVLSRLGEDPSTIVLTSERLDALVRQDSRAKSLVGRFYSRLSQLHDSCFCVGICNQETERRIRETSDYIRDAESLA